MTVASVACRAQVGLQAPLVEVQVSVASGLPTFNIVGLPATVVRESRERVRAALVHCGFDFPAGRITVSLAPAEVPKEGGRFDLPIAIGIALASGQLGAARPNDQARGAELYGELGLAGELKPVRGLLLAATRASECGNELIVPLANAAEAATAARTPVRAARHLLEVVAHLSGRALLRDARAELDAARTRRDFLPALAMSDVRGQLFAKRALAIAAAGGHSLLMIGPPGAGKSMLARRLPGLLPPLTEAEALEVAAVASVSDAGFRPDAFGVRPFRAPHHSASLAALVGGGPLAQPGEISLAHSGVLFLDELPEFDRRVLDALREPLETGLVSIARARRRAEYPAAFQLVAAMNPCPCGWRGDPRKDCSCKPAQLLRYRARVSGPLLDRVDIHIEVPRLAASEFDRPACGSPSATQLARRIARAHERQMSRQGICNARLPEEIVTQCCRIDRSARALLESAMQRFGLSARGRQRILKLARTIADLAGRSAISEAHVAEAVMLRQGERRDL